MLQRTLFKSVRSVGVSRTFATVPIPSEKVGPTDVVKDSMQKLDDKKIQYHAHVNSGNLESKGKLGKCPVLSSNEYLMRSAERESNGRTYVRRYPFAIKKAEGIILTDTDGKQYYDALGCAGTLALGHNHPVTLDAIRKFIDSGAPLQVLDMATPEKDEFMTELASVLPKELSRQHFCGPAGTDCLEAAVKMCKIATGRRSVLSFHGGYHGHGQGALAMMGNLGAKNPVPGLMPDVYFLPYPYTFRNPFGVNGPEGEKAVMNYIRSVLRDDESGIPTPACIVVEAIQGEGGVNGMSRESLKELRQITKDYNIPLIIDEVQAGFCRSGDFFAFQHGDIVPDVLCMSKAVGGSMPMAVMAFREELDKWGPGAHTGTFRGNQLSFACGTASLRFMKENKLWEDVARKGEKLMNNLRDIGNGIGRGYVGDVRGRGLIVGMEMVDPNSEVDVCGIHKENGPLAAAIQAECIRRGLILERGGRGGSVVRFLPPLIISDQEIDIISSIYGDAVEAAIKKIHG